MQVLRSSTSDLAIVAAHGADLENTNVDLPTQPGPGTPPPALRRMSAESHKLAAVVEPADTATPPSGRPRHVAFTVLVGVRTNAYAIMNWRQP